HGLDGVPAVGDAGWLAGRRSDETRTEPVPLAFARRRLRQRQRLHERCRRAMVSRTEARSDTLACVQEERSGVRRAEEWCRRPPPDGLRPLRRPRNGARDGPPLCGGTALRQLLPAVVQAEGEAPRRGESDQALSCSVDALPA